MKQSLIKLVDAILRRMEEHPEVPQTERRMRVWLREQGFKKGDIDAAMKLVRPHFELKPRVEDYKMGVARTFSGWEEVKLSVEARNALVRLELYGLIDPYEREMILDRLNHFDGEVTLEELDYLLSWVVCSNRDVETQQTIYSVLEGHKDILH